jgi:hypothetical protein
MLAPLFEALTDLGVETARIVYSDEAVDHVQEELLQLDGVLVWVNPIQDGDNRARLDRLLRDVAARGVWVSTQPDVIDRMGTKEVLFRTRRLGWGTDTDLYRTPDELAQRFPERLGRAGRIVLKQARGTAGNGVWRIDLLQSSGAVPDLNTSVRIQHALTRDAASEETTLGAFLQRCDEYFAWSGLLVSQPYQARLADGMIRCYFTHDKVVGLCHQWPTGLLDATRSEPRSRGPWEDADAPAYAPLRTRAENQWVPAMVDLLGLERHSLPVIWDADFLYGPRTPSGEDTFVLCEINVSAVWPFPPQASGKIARAALDRVLASKNISVS